MLQTMRAFFLTMLFSIVLFSPPVIVGIIFILNDFTRLETILAIMCTVALEMLLGYAHMEKTI